MGRKVKRGLDYFPFDIDFFQDIKIRKLIRRQSGKAITVYALLLCFIYKDGYYMRWDKELPFIISELSGYDEVYISEVIKDCIALGLFSHSMFETEGILTSAGIQERYQRICADCKRKCMIREFDLISSEEMPINSEEMPISSEEMGIYSEEMPINSEESTQSKVKKSKVKESNSSCKGTADAAAAAGKASAVCRDTAAAGGRGTVEADVRALRADASWLEVVQMRYKLTPAGLAEWLDAFVLDCRANGKTVHTGLGEAKSHFCSWLRIRLKHTTTDHANQQSTAARRRGTDAAAHTAADYLGGL